MKTLCYLKFLKYCEENDCVIERNKYNMRSVNICLKNHPDKHVHFSINKPPFTEYDLQYFLTAFGKYKTLDLGSFINECEMKITPICPITEYEEKFIKIPILKDHCRLETNSTNLTKITNSTKASKRIKVIKIIKEIKAIEAIEKSRAMKTIEATRVIKAAKASKVNKSK